MGGALNRSIQADIARVREAYQAGDIHLAEARLAKLIQAHPNRPDVLMARGMVYLGKGEQERALDVFKAALEIAPTLGETLAWAAYVCLNLRRNSEAEEYAKRLTDVNPINPRGHYLLASALRAQGNTEQALLAIDRALAISPDDVDCLVTKARLLREWQAPAQATELYQKAMAIRPTLSAALELAQIAMRDSQPQVAVEVLRKVEPTLPVANRPHAPLAEAYTMMRSFDEAEKHWQLAAKYSGNPPGLKKSRALAEIAVGRFNVAEEILFQMIDRGEDPAASFAILTTCKKMRADDRPLIDRMASLLSRADLSPDERIDLSYGLGKSFDDLRDFERAIRHYDEANAIGFQAFQRQRAYDPDKARAFTDFIIESSTPERLRAREPRGLESSLPLFVVGMMRSGTTLTESILSAHSQVKGGGEQAFWTERVVEFIFGEGGILYCDHDLVLKFAGEYLRLIDPKEGDTRYVIDKNPTNIDLAGILHTAYPQAKIVHLKRHPVDNLLSIWMTPVTANVRYASNRANLVFTYREYVRLWKHWEKVLPPDRFATYHYEDLTSHPGATIHSMLDFLEVDHEEACFAPERNVRSVLTPSAYQVRQPIHTGSQARWKNYLPWLGEFAELLEEAEAGSKRTGFWA